MTHMPELSRRVAVGLALACAVTLWTPSTALLAAERFPVYHTDVISLHPGEVETLRIRDIERVAVGNDAIVSTSLLENDELLIIPQQPGDTEIVVWQAGNRKQLIRIKVTASDSSNLLREVRARLSQFRDLSISVRENLVIVRGQVNSEQRLNSVKALLGSELLQQVVLQLDVDSLAVIRSSLAHISTLEVVSLNDAISLTGSYAPEFGPTIEMIVQRYPQIINLAQLDGAKMKSMILIDVKIVELRKRNLEQLGIRWDNSIAGPSAGLAATAIKNPYFRTYSDVNNAGQIVDFLPPGETGLHGSLGVISSIGSQIDLLQESGEARMLARPMLSARDGSSATFHSGGELPYPVVDPDTGNIAVSFRSYGVSLNVLPQLSHEGKIMVEVNAEVSSIDSSININGVPGLISKSVSSTINAREGETIVMSGLLANTQTEGVSKIPVLGDLPLIGALFRTNSSESDVRELAIFLTPRIKRLDYRGDQGGQATEPFPLETLGQKAERQTKDMNWLSNRIQD